MSKRTLYIYIKTTTFSALQKYKRSHDNARANGSHSNASIVPFAVDTLGNFCSVAITILKAVAKIKFAKISNIAEVKEHAASIAILQIFENYFLIKDLVMVAY